MSFTYSGGGVMPMPQLAWDFQSSNVDYIQNLTPSYSTVNGALTNLPTYVAGKYNQAIRLTQTEPNAGANSYVLWSLASSPISIDTTGITITCWVNWTTFQGSFVSMYDAFTNVLGIYMTSTVTQTGRGFSGTQALTNATANTSTNSTGVWYHIALTYNSTSVILYKNGVGTTPVATGAPGVTITGIRIGSQANNIQGTYVGYACADCTIDDLRIYNTALTAAQVQSIYNQQGVPGRGVQVREVQPLLLGNATILYGGAPTGNTALNCSGPYATVSNLLSLGTSSPVNFNYNSSNLFCEFWWYTSNLTYANLNTPLSLGSLTTSASSFRLQVRVNSGFAALFSTSASNTTTLGVNTWFHFATSIDSTNKKLYVFVNGYGAAPVTYTGTLTYNSAHSVSVGYSNALALNYYYDQIIKDMRVIRGGVVPITNFTPESAPWAYGSSPSYVVGGTNVLGLAAQYMSPMPMSGTPLFTQLSPSATSSAVGAFSLRAVNGTVAKAVQVRNGTTSAIQDFYADRLGNLLTAPVTGQTLANWLGTATGYVTTWYDQSGRGNHATQGTAANQPIITKATKGSGYSCLFNGANSQVLSCAAGTYSLLNGTKYAVCVTERRNNSGTQGGYFGIGSTGGGGAGMIAGYFNSDTTMEYSHRGDNLDNTVAAFAGASEPIRYTVFDYSASTTKRVYINSSILPITNTSYDLAATSGAMTIGKSFATVNSTYYYGEMYEVLVFTKSLYDIDGTSTITQIYNNQVGIYGT